MATRCRRIIRSTKRVSLPQRPTTRTVVRGTVTVRVTRTVTVRRRPIR